MPPPLGLGNSQLLNRAARHCSSSTTTDLLEAQTALTTAKLNLVRANYEQAISGVALNRALGE